jgi:hypothetical protein
LLAKPSICRSLMRESYRQRFGARQPGHRSRRRSLEASGQRKV